MAVAIEAVKLRKEYNSRRKRVVALDGVDISVETGRLFSFLGRNGAGKTTFVKILSTLLLPTSGNAFVLGHDVVKETAAVRDSIALVPQDVRPYFHLTPREHSYNYLRIRGHSREEAKSRTDWVLHEMGLERFADIPSLQLSGGLQQRTMVATVLATMAPVIFLDEPTLGMDPLARREVWKLIEEIRQKGSTIFLTTHYLDEAERLSEQLAVISRGRILFKGTVPELKVEVGFDYRAILNRNAPKTLFDGFTNIVEDGGRILVLTDREGALSLAEAASRANVEISVGPVTLEEAFIQLVGSSEEDES
ncbi:MAG: ABC transporter ATP-binding protein [Thermoplasmata archaeon]|uniref:ABC transporter ATP-binding protein n=1 Tax=Candidatus Sysuiplasma superficiale TaxID=2823368 RepID=A0A8J7YND5_9ARCH|nr:ABC transporter ATP-binding protein [Candidatus Sysuiplasma superficiale]MBX8643575.1 ABC transporter ATP-binding protein [Candidatus Sysuiplasma superficiale]MCL4346956.1 ABC transporter ATP-binding protein [Candidatus Thermoplasmatota archaeon]MCL5437509.1 ABC transporter ATP-binding protein [Candidatus Thermoplasmatota archaeon]